LASGFVNAGGSLGQFIFAPLNQLLIASFSWTVAMWSMAVAALTTIPLATPLLRDREAAAKPSATPAKSALTLRETALDSLARQELLVPARRLLHLRDSTSRSWSPTCRVRYGCAACRHRWPPARWPSSGSRTSPAVSRPAGPAA
jgi:hypothetical protein